MTIVIRAVGRPIVPCRRRIADGARTGQQLVKHLRDDLDHRPIVLVRLAYNAAMELILVRHGIAEDRQPHQADADRQLTHDGIEKTQQVAQGLTRIAPTPDVILTSPRLRAVQTAQILGQAFGVAPAETDALSSSDLNQMLEVIRAQDAGCVLIVGHEPDFSSLIETIVFSKPLGTVQMKKAGAALVEFPTRRRAGVLHWLATPKMLRKLA